MRWKMDRPRGRSAGYVAETSGAGKPSLSHARPKDIRERGQAQGLTMAERKLLGYLRKSGADSIAQSIRRYAEDLWIPREDVKRALQGLQRKGYVKLRKGDESRLEVSLIGGNDEDPQGSR